MDNITAYFERVPVETTKHPPFHIEGDCLILVTEPNREMTVQANLIMRHVPFYLPTIFRPSRIRARAQGLGADHPDVLVPLFPRTIFVPQSVIQERLHEIRSLPGMSSNPLMKFGEHFAVLRPLVLQVVRLIEAGEREYYFRNKRRRLVSGFLPKIGDEVKVLVDKVMGGLVGRVSEVDERGRITILTEIMKRTVAVHTTADNVEPV